MKKFALLCAVALLLSSVSIGCSSSGSSWCRTGSLFPTSRAPATQSVYMTAASYQRDCNPCDAAACNPCDAAACNPCDAIACNPCDPMCDPCVRTGYPRARGVYPGPVMTN